jgi:hypothetical protein
VYLSRAALAQRPEELAAATQRIVSALRSLPGLERVERSADFWGHCETRTGDAFVLCVTLDPERSGEIIYLPARGWVLQSSHDALATSHGSMQPYDRLVPVIMLPPGRVPHAALAMPDDTTIQMGRIATILARWLGVTPPSSLP